MINNNKQQRIALALLLGFSELQEVGCRLPFKQNRSAILHEIRGFVIFLNVSFHVVETKLRTLVCVCVYREFAIRIIHRELLKRVFLLRASAWGFLFFGSNFDLRLLAVGTR